MTDLLKKLAGGGLRSIGRSNEVVAQVIESPALISELFEGLFHEDARVRARASDALEKSLPDTRIGLRNTEPDCCVIT
jgi:hypothetical protein